MMFSKEAHIHFHNNLNERLTYDIRETSKLFRLTPDYRPTNHTLYILSQTYNATLFLFDYFYVNAHALSKMFFFNSIARQVR